MKYNKLFIQEALKYNNVNDFLTAKVSKEMQDLFWQEYGKLSILEAKEKIKEIYFYSKNTLDKI